MIFLLVDGASAHAEVAFEPEHRSSNSSIATAASERTNATEIELAGVI